MATSMNPRAFAYQWQPPPQPRHAMALERVHHIRVSSEYANIYIYTVYVYMFIYIYMNIYDNMCVYAYNMQVHNTYNTGLRWF